MCSAHYDHHHCYVEYKDGVSYPHHYPHAGHDHCLNNYHCEPRAAPIPSKNNQLYGKALLDLGKKTEANLARLTRVMSRDPPRPPVQAWAEGVPSTANATWDDKQSVFTTKNQMDRYFWKRPLGDDWEDTSNNGAINKCYLCSTLDEHRQHLARRGPQLKPKPRAKPRILFIPPAPVVRKVVKEREERKEALYKVTVRTGTQPNAGTSAKVFITMHGRTQTMTKRQLCKRLTCDYCFGRGTSEIFYLKGPDMGELRHITIEHDGFEKKHSWFLEDVQVLSMSTNECWAFVYHQWLSLYLGPNLSIKTHIRAQRTEIEESNWEVHVFTADKIMAGTDANVFITLYGKCGVSRRKPLTKSSKNAFERGEEDVFLIRTDYLGPISRIRIEHGNSGRAPGWLLEKVILIEEDNNQRKYVFPCGEWLRHDDDDGDIFKELFPLRRGDKLAGGSRKAHQVDRTDGTDGSNGRGRLLDYKMTVITGDRSYAGTDAGVFVQMKGTSGITREVQLNNNSKKSPFEKGNSDKFKVKVEDVGQLKKLNIRHDNSHMAAGWFLKKVIVRRFFSKYEVSERLQKEHSDPDADRKARYQKLQTDSSDDSESEDTTSSDDDNKEKLYTRWEKNRIPFCDEYVFPCDRWLADDEDDCLIARELKPASVTQFYRVQKR